jgi:formiminotetrahydrofolate cyclodeaminase
MKIEQIKQELQKLIDKDTKPFVNKFYITELIKNIKE